MKLRKSCWNPFRESSRLIGDLDAVLVRLCGES